MLAIVPNPLRTMAYAELVAAEREAREERDTADKIMMLNDGIELVAEEERFCEAEARIFAIEKEIRRRLQAHVGDKAVLEQILRII